MAKPKNFKSKENEIERAGKSQKGREHREYYLRIKYFLKWLRSHKIDTIRGNELQKLWELYFSYKDTQAYTPEDRLLLKTLSYRTRAPFTISVSKEEYRVYKKECTRYLHLLEQIAKDYRKQYYRHFAKYIPSPTQDESTKGSVLIDIPTKFGWKF